MDHRTTLGVRSRDGETKLRVDARRAEDARGHLRRRCLASLWVACAWCAPAAVARAQARNDAPDRQQLLVDASHAREQGDHRRALGLATRAASIESTPPLRLFIAEEQHALGRDLDAIASAEACVQGAERDPQLPNRTSLLQQCRNLADDVERARRLAANSSNPPANSRVRPPHEEMREYQPWSEIAALEPRPGLVPLIVESIGGRVSVGVDMGHDLTTFRGHTWGRMFYSDACASPCTLYVLPGPFPLWTGNHGAESTRASISVPSTGIRVRVRRGSAALTALGLAFSMVGLLGVWPTGIATGFFSTNHGIAFAASLSGYIGAHAVLAAGLTLIAVYRGGVASREPLASSASEIGARPSSTVLAATRSADRPLWDVPTTSIGVSFEFF